MDEANKSDLVELTAEIISAYVSNNTVVPEALPGVIADVHEALSKAAQRIGPAEREELRPAVAVKKSVTPDYLICLEDGKKFHVFGRRLHRRINNRFGFQVQATRLLQKTKGKSRDDAERVLAVNPAPLESQGNTLLEALLLGEIRKVDRLFENRRGSSAFFTVRFDAQRERRQCELLIFKFQHRIGIAPFGNGGQLLSIHSKQLDVSGKVVGPVAGYAAPTLGTQRSAQLGENPLAPCQAVVLDLMRP